MKKFEQNSTNSPLAAFVAQKTITLKERQQERAETTGTYPRTIEDYNNLELDKRMSTAVKIFYNEAPRIRRTEKPPHDTYGFDISELTDEDNLHMKADIYYSEGKWTNALNSTHVERLPHLAIAIRTSMDGFYITDPFGDLEICDHYKDGGGGYNHYVFSHRSFRVREAGWQGAVIDDPEHPLFREVVNIVDLGIAALYKEKLTRRIERLGNLAIDS